MDRGPDGPLGKSRGPGRQSCRATFAAQLAAFPAAPLRFVFSATRWPLDRRGPTRRIPCASTHALRSQREPSPAKPRGTSVALIPFARIRACKEAVMKRAEMKDMLQWDLDRLKTLRDEIRV